MRIQKGIDMQGGMISAQLRSPIHGKKSTEKASHLNKQKWCFLEIGFAWNLHTLDVAVTPTLSFQEVRAAKTKARRQGNFSYQTITHKCASHTFVCTWSRCRLIPPVLIHRIRPKPAGCLPSRYALTGLELLACSAHSAEATDQPSGNARAQTRLRRIMLFSGFAGERRKEITSRFMAE